MSFARVKISSWAVGEILTSAQMNQLDTDHANAVDGVGGGFYTMSAGAFLGFLADGSVNPALIVASSGLLPALSLSSPFTTGSALSAIGTVRMDSNSGTPHQLIGATEVASGSTFTLKGATQWTACDSRNVKRLQSVFAAHQAGTTWVSSGNGGWTDNDTSTPGAILFELNNLIDGASLYAVEIDLIGNVGPGPHAGLPGTMPTYRMFSSSAGAPVAISALVTDSSTLSVYDTNRTVTVTLTSPITINETAGLQSFFLTISGESGANALNGRLYVYRARALFTVTSIQPGG